MLTNLGQRLSVAGFPTDNQVHPIATVITAVWHQQADKESLLKGHMENLRRQSAPYRAIYAFDASDTPPSWLEGMKILVSDPLTQSAALPGTPLITLIPEPRPHIYNQVRATSR